MSLENMCKNGKLSRAYELCGVENWYPNLPKMGSYFPCVNNCSP